MYLPGGVTTRLDRKTPVVEGRLRGSGIQVFRQIYQVHHLELYATILTTP